ncbi:hypothetical protein ACFLW1_01585 [Chloroflexota bacterium]
MKRLVISLTMALLLVAVMTAPVMALEGTVDAGVTVNEFVSVTITDQNSDGIQFGTVNPDTNDNPDQSQSTASDVDPSVVIAIDAITNTNCNVSVKGTDFDVVELPLANASWSLTYDGAKTVMTTGYVSMATGVVPGNAINMFNFLTIPDTTDAGTYGSTYTFEVVPTT